MEAGSAASLVGGCEPQLMVADSSALLRIYHIPLRAPSVSPCFPTAAPCYQRPQMHSVLRMNASSYPHRPAVVSVVASWVEKTRDPATFVNNSRGATRAAGGRTGPGRRRRLGIM